MIIPSSLLKLCQAFRQGGGRAFLVGGCVRDSLLGLPLKDYDVEVYHLSASKVEAILKTFGSVSHVGAAFGVFKVEGFSPSVDVSLPRLDTHTGPGHRGFTAQVVPFLPFKEAARRRDLTINSMSYDPLTQEYFDPFEGKKDLEEKRLRATDPKHFSQDPLRGLRVAQFAARFSMTPDEELKKLCTQLDLSSLSGERLWGEWEKLLSLSPDPSPGLIFLLETGQLNFFPGLAHLRGGNREEALTCPDLRRLQDQTWRQISFLSHLYPAPRSLPQQALFLFLLLQEAFEEEREEFFQRLRGPKLLETLVRELHKLIPFFKEKKASLHRPFYFCWADRLHPFSLTLKDIFHLLQGLEEDQTLPSFLAADWHKLEEWGIATSPPPPPLVTGKDLQDRGIAPGPLMGQLLNQCRIYQYASGDRHKEDILRAVLGSGTPSP